MPSYHWLLIKTFSGTVTMIRCSCLNIMSSNKAAKRENDMHTGIQEGKTKMRAIVRQEYGGPDQLVIQELAIPEPRPSQVVTGSYFGARPSGREHRRAGWRARDCNHSQPRSPFRCWRDWGPTESTWKDQTFHAESANLFRDASTLFWNWWETVRFWTHWRWCAAADASDWPGFWAVLNQSHPSIRCSRCRAGCILAFSVVLCSVRRNSLSAMFRSRQ
jgi:hypothetical protein